MIEYRTELTGIGPEHLKGFFVSWRRPLDPERHLEVLANSTLVVLACDTRTGRVVGFVNALSDGVNSAFIPLLEVLAGYQRRGIGQELVRRMLSMLGDIPCIDLTCDADMQPFYEQFGLMRSHGMISRK